MTDENCPSCATLPRLGAADVAAHALVFMQRYLRACRKSNNLSTRDEPDDVAAACPVATGSAPTWEDPTLPVRPLVFRDEPHARKRRTARRRIGA